MDNSAEEDKEDVRDQAIKEEEGAEDYDKTSLNQAKENNPNIRFVIEDMGEDIHEVERN
jgi:hypothetical protein